MRRLLLFLLLPVLANANPTPTIDHLSVNKNVVMVVVNRPDSEICGLSLLVSGFPFGATEKLAKQISVMSRKAGETDFFEISPKREGFGFLNYSTSGVYGYANSFYFSTKDGRTLKEVLKETLELGEEDVVIVMQTSCN